MESHATEALLESLQNSETGQLTVGTAKKQYQVSILNGSIVGATSSVDRQKLLHRLNLEKQLPISRIKALESLIKQKQPIMGLLIDEVDHRRLEKLLFEQYLDNICAYLGSSDRPVFKKLEAIFVDNLQLGHEPFEMVERCAQLWDQADKLNLRAKLVIGPRPPDNELQGLIFERLNKRPRSAATLTMMLPLEPVAARALLSNMIRARMAVVDGDPVEQSLTKEENEALDSMVEIRRYAAQVVPRCTLHEQTEPRQVLGTSTI
jgi:hypothetical protein